MTTRKDREAAARLYLGYDGSDDQHASWCTATEHHMVPWECSARLSREDADELRAFQYPIYSSAITSRPGMFSIVLDDRSKPEPRTRRAQRRARIKRNAARRWYRWKLRRLTP